MAEQILKPKDLETINKALEDLNAADEHIRQAEAAGIEVGEVSKNAQALRNQFNRLKQAYFPNG